MLLGAYLHVHAIFYLEGNSQSFVSYLDTLSISCWSLHQQHVSDLSLKRTL